MIKYLRTLQKQDLENKRVLVRVDFDVAVKDGKITDDFRIESHKETINYLLENGAKVLLVSHLGHDDPSATFLPIVEQIGEILGHTLTLVPLNELSSVSDLFKVCQMILLENIRQDSREIENNKEFALSLSKGFDFYVNDAFAVCHRNHASVSAITELLPYHAGFQMENEIKNLSKAVSESAEGKVVVLGGAKISTKLPTIKNFLDKSEKILIGGALANNFFKYQNMEVGKSLVDNESLNLLGDLYNSGVLNEKIVLPIDFVIAEENNTNDAETKNTGDIEKESAILDIGPETIRKFQEIIGEAKMVIWNGPMGFFEIEKFAAGTESIADVVSLVKQSIIGGGDTIAAVKKLDLLNKFSFISTGGGAMLDFLAGKKLPGLEVLGFYDLL